MTATRTKTTCGPILKRLGACSDAIAFAGKLTPAQAWKTCRRGDWLIWAAGNLDIGRNLLVRAACDCARTALKHVPAGEHRPRVAIETAERWCDGQATIEEVRAASYAAYAASYEAYAASYEACAASYAAYAAAYAADATAYAADVTAYAAAYAADATAYVADATAYVACADLVRARIPWATMANAIKRHQERP